MLYKPFIDGAGTTFSKNFQLEDCVNWLLENASLEGAKTEKGLFGAFGLALHQDLGEGPVRGQFSFDDGTEYVVSGPNVFSKDAGDVYTNIGTVANDTLPVKMVANGNQVALRSGGFLYRLQGGVITGPIAGPWAELTDIETLNGYYMALDRITGVWFLSAPGDCTIWDALDFSTAPASNNSLLALWTQNNQLLVLGSVSIQPFFNNGNADFPYQLNESGVIDGGIRAAAAITSVAKDATSSDLTTFFLSQTANGDAQVMKLAGASTVRVSTNALETIFQKYPQLENTKAWGFQMNGHQMAMFCFTSASWLYDATTDKWFQWGWTNPSSGLYEAVRGVNHAFNKGRHLVGDRTAGVIWEMADTHYQDGNPDDPTSPLPLISRRRVLLPSDGTKRIFVSRIEALGETGVGLVTGTDDEINPQIGLSMSWDSGHNFGTTSYTPMGRMGDTEARMYWTALGSGRQPAVEVVISSPVKRVLTGLDIQMKAGVS